jgi:hypothetical protein
VADSRKGQSNHRQEATCRPLLEAAFAHFHRCWKQMAACDGVVSEFELSDLYMMLHILIIRLTRRSMSALWAKPNVA